MMCRYGANSLGTLASMSRTPASMVHREMTNPSTAAGIARSALSVRSCRTSRARAAPSASRIPISRCRAMPRASITLATLAQAISRTRAKATTAGVNTAIVSSVRGSPPATETRPARAQRRVSGGVGVAVAAQAGDGAQHAKRFARYGIPEHGTALGARERILVRKALRRYRQRTQILVLPPGETLARAAAILKEHLVERSGVADRERPQHVGIEDREDAGVQPEAERDREHDRGDEGRGAAKTAEREAHVLAQFH